MLGRATRIPYGSEPYPDRAPIYHRSGSLLRAILAVLIASLVMAAPAGAAGELYILGAGYGHGVGMSQYGAYGYALHGYGYRSILAHYYSHTSLGKVDPTGYVTVLLATGKASFTGANRAGPVKLNPGFTYDVRPLSSGDLRLLTTKGKRVATFTKLAVSGSGPLVVPGLGAYRGELEFSATKSGAVETINAVQLDDYVRGVITAEMPSSWSMAALEAQAVAARTYAITTDAGGSAFEQYSDTRSQVYGGVAAETARGNAAVAATSGQVVTYDGRPALTYFFSSSGGHTEDVENVFGGPAYAWLRGVPDPYDDAGGNPHYRWRVSLGTARASSTLGSLVSGQLIGIRVLTHGASPRILTAAVVGTGGTRQVTGAELEQRFGLQSTWAAFTTITTVVRPERSARLRATVAELALPLPLVRAVIDRAPVLPALAGTVFPAPRGAHANVQALVRGRWHTIGYTVLGNGGAYAVQAPRRGTYRIVYQGLAGPAVTV